MAQPRGLVLTVTGTTCNSSAPCVETGTEALASLRSSSNAAIAPALLNGLMSAENMELEPNTADGVSLVPIPVEGNRANQA